MAVTPASGESIMSNIVNIEQATRAGAHLLIQAFGGPRSGKTYTALQLARGIAGPKGKIGVLDTESGRARLYSDKVPGGFAVGELSPPFTPDRYRQAIEQFVEFGADVLVIDSFSHVWNGPGGVLELADQQEAGGKKGLQKWLKPKVEYRKLVGFLLSTRIHIIFCSRGKQPVVEQTNNGRKEFVTLPWEPVQDKHLKYEMTIVLPMILDGTFETAPDRLKCPGDLKHLFTGQPLTSEVGAEIAKWVAGGQAVNHADELLRKHANDAAADGSDAFRAFWKALKQPQRAVLQPALANYQSIAKEADDEQARQPITIEGAGQTGIPDDPFAGGADSAAGPETSGNDIAPPFRIPVTLTPENETDWDGFMVKARAAIASAPDAAWLTQWADLHKVTLVNMTAHDPALRAELGAVINEKMAAHHQQAA
jgi:hypothetical protein